MDLVVLTMNSAIEHPDTLEAHRRTLTRMRGEVEAMYGAIVANAEAAILHEAQYECDECGGPSPETSSQGCRFCGGQGNIVPRGMARRRTWHPV